MIIKVQYEDQDYVYEIPLNKLLEFLNVSESEVMAACKKAIMRL